MFLLRSGLGARVGANSDAGRCSDSSAAIARPWWVVVAEGATPGGRRVGQADQTDMDTGNVASQISVPTKSV